MNSSDIKVIGETFQKIADIVTPTMGAQGRLAVIAQDLDKPVLTDDGVTVARTALSLTGFERVPAISMIEAASNTEKEAYDGTTLTVLLTNEFYKYGQYLIKHKHYHPQMAARQIERFAENIRKELKKNCNPIQEYQIKELSTITTKIPTIGDIVYEAYKAAGKDMNVVIEHDMKISETQIEHTSGLILNSGYMSDVMRSFCNENSKTVYDNAKLILLSEDLFTATQIMGFFKTIPAEADPLVFIVTPKFNPESLKILLDALVPNSDKIKFQFIFLNEDATDELYLDIAAYTNGQIQDAALGTSNYKYEYCGTADRIIIEREKTTIVASGDTTKRIESYKQMLSEHAYELSVNTEASIRRRLSNLQTGLVKIKLACPTVTEYMTIKLKLDDAIGAVRKAFKEGILPGAGRAMMNIAFGYHKSRCKAERKLLAAPMKQILSNAGYSKLFKKVASNPNQVIDVTSGVIVHAVNHGIIDSFSSIGTAVKNAASIASSYIKAFVVITR